MVDSGRGFSFASNGCIARSHVTCTHLHALQHIVYCLVEFGGPEVGTPLEMAFSETVEKIRSVALRGSQLPRYHTGAVNGQGLEKIWFK